MANIEQAKKDIADAKSRHTEAAKDIKRIERDMSDFSNNKDDKLAELQSAVDKLKKNQVKTSVSVKNLQKELQSARMESEQAGADLAAAKEQLAEVDTAIESQQVELRELENEQSRAKVDSPHGNLTELLTRSQNSHDQAQARLAEERATLSVFDEELRSLEEALRNKSSRITEEGLEMQKLSHAIERSQKEQTTASQTLSQMESEHEWIREEKESFGRANTPYDFHGQNIVESKSSLKNLTERFQGMKKKINPKVMNMIDSVEKKEAGLKSMMKTVIRDKRKIEETIVSLDEYKKEALQKTWTKVNGDFGQIFADLLPGSFAKLDPPEGKAISDGLEVKVSLGKVWKQSLTELSGGQRYVFRVFRSIARSLTFLATGP